MTENQLKLAGVIFVGLAALVADVLGIIRIDSLINIPRYALEPINILSTLICIASSAAVILLGIRPYRKDKMRTIILALSLFSAGLGLIFVYQAIYTNRLVSYEGCGAYFVVADPLPGEFRRSIATLRANGDRSSQNEMLGKMLCNPNRPERATAMESATALHRVIITLLLSVAKSAIFVGLFILLWTITMLNKPAKKSAKPA